MPHLDYQTPRRSPLPSPLVLVGILFISIGSIGLFWMVLLLSQGTFWPDFCSPCILIWGIGLLRLNRTSYNMAIATLILAMVFFACQPLLFFSPADPAFNLFGKSPAEHWLSIATILAADLALLALAFWQYRVLSRPSIKQLFETPPH